MLTGMPFLLYGIRVLNGLYHQMPEAGSKFGNHLYAIVAENLLVIDFDDRVILALRSLDVEADRVIIHVRAFGEFYVACGNEAFRQTFVAFYFREQPAQVVARRICQQTKRLQIDFSPPIREN